MINFNEISFKYSALKNQTIKNISFEILEGEKVLIVGKSGSGKSTISKMINGLIPNSYSGEITGEAFVNELEIGKSSIFSLSKEIGTILQDQDAQFIGLTAAEDISFFLENTKTDTEEMKKKVNEVLELLDIKKLKDYKPQELSGGEKQRVSVAGVLVNDVRCLLLDEPLANLDPKSSVEILELLNELNAKYGKSIIMIEHRLEEAFKIDFDRVILIDDGQLIYNGPPSTLLKTNLLTNMGIRKPLYIEVLEKLNYDFTNVNNMLDYSSFDLQDLKIPSSNKVNNFINSKVVLEIKNLEFGYYDDYKIIKGLNLSVREGEIVALLGNNGAGKSTLSSAIVGINKKYTGDILINNNNINNLDIFNRGKMIGYVMQNPNHSITEDLVFDEVAYSLKLQNIKKDIIESRVDNILEICGLLKYKNWPINMLSYGQKRRVTIASILIKEPKLLILDEPTAGQDYDTFKSIMKLVKKLSKEYNLSIIIITHNMQLAYEYCDRALVLNDGKIIFDDTMNNLYMEEDILKKASLKETSIQSFSKFHNINSTDFGSLITNQSEEGSKDEC